MLCRAPSDDRGSLSDSDTASSHDTGDGHGPHGGARDNSHNNPSGISNTGSSKRSSRGDGNSEGCVATRTSIDAHETPGRWMSEAKRRKMHEQGLQTEDQGGGGQ